MSEELYARQHATYRTTHESIIIAAKKLMAEQGFRAMNMIELASEAEVSRATLYNHFRDKDAVGIALIQFEVGELIAISSESPVDYLVALSQFISTNTALQSIRNTDPELIAKVFQPNGHDLWREVGEVLNKKLGSLAPVAVLWLLGQILAPISAESARKQAMSILNR